MSSLSKRWTVLVACLMLAACTGSGSGSDSASVAAPASTLSPHRWATLADHRIHFLDSGGDARQALVLVHGWAGSAAAWSKQFPALADRARVLAVDLVGHGESEGPVYGYTMASMADSVRAAMDTAGVERAVLVGHSNGVPVVLDFAHRFPERTLAVVGIDGALKAMLSREAFDAAFAPFRGEDWQAVMTAMIEGMPAPGLSAEDRAAITAMAVATPQHVVLRAAEAQFLPGAFHEPSLRMPVLLLYARQPTFDAAYEAWVRRGVPQVEYVVWDGVGHYIQMERPEEFEALLREFLDRHGLLPR